MKAELLFIVAALVLAGCGNKDVKSTEKGGNPLNAPADYLGAVNQAKKVSVKQIDLAYLHNAIALFQAQEDRYPKDLNELVQQHYIQQVPAAPYGMQIVYNPANGQVQVVRK